MADRSNANLTGITGILSNATLQGDSAYEVAVKNGFVGTEAEWLASLKGDQGDQGIQGPVGPTGSTGDTGNGISNISIDSGGYMEILTTDGTNYRFYAKGDKGDTGSKGDTGTGIRSVVLNSDYTLTITLTDDATYTTGSIRGVKGDTGVGISDIALNQDYTLTVTMDDGTSYTTESIRGEKGETGSKGDKGDTGDDGVSATVEVTSDTDSDYRLTFTDVNGSIETPNLYSDVTASAKQLLSESYTLDQVPYLFRKSPDSDRAVESIVGGTVGWNQLVYELTVDNWLPENGVTASFDNGVATISSTAASNGIFMKDAFSAVKHKYLIMADIKGPSGLDARVSVSSAQIGMTKILSGNGWEHLSTMRDNTIEISNRLYIYGYGQTYSDLQVKNVIITDLTTMLGSTIADYIYSLETATAGAGVAKLKEWGFFTEDYYEYCEPTLKNVEGLLRKKTVGFNQWDEEWEEGRLNYDINSPTWGQNVSSVGIVRSKNHIRVVPNTTYYCSKGSSAAAYAIYYDANKQPIPTTMGAGYEGIGNKEFVTPSNAQYMRFYATGLSTYNHDICINLSDSTKNGTYEPYESHTYSLDSSVVLRGVPKLDSNNNLYYDGDTYESDGSVSRMFTERAYQSGDESLADAITDGTTTVVKLATPTTFTAQPYHNPQIVGDTEEFVTTGLVPVGHETKYFLDLRSRIEGLPDDFSTLIAPTEVTNKATKNYTKGELLILNNQLYKVTSAIANNGTITVNTNVRATTIAQEISPLVPPTLNGTYALKATVSSGNVTYSWVAG